MKLKTRRTLGVSFRSLLSGLSKTLLGWRSCYGFNEVPNPLREVEKWIRRLRCYLWKRPLSRSGGNIHIEVDHEH